MRSDFQRRRRKETGGATRLMWRLNSVGWCAWQESNLLPFGPEPNALSGELQARDRFTSLEGAAS